MKSLFETFFVYRLAEGAGAFGWAVNEKGDLRSACVARSETGHSANHCGGGIITHPGRSEPS